MVIKKLLYLPRFKLNDMALMSKNLQEDTHVVNQIKSGTHIQGEVKSESDIRIDGSLKGTINTQGKLVIGVTGKIEGEITCASAEIHGTFNGKIMVTELLSLKASSKLIGDIVIGKLSIEPGAQFSGTCVMGNAVKGLINNNGQQNGQAGKERFEKRETVVA
jgi:cytoskeletal protein CcmA (bactofilin family)